MSGSGEGRPPRRAGAAALIAALRAELRRRGLSLRQVAGAAGVSEPTLRRWLNGRGLTLDRLDRLCEIAGLDVRDLVEPLPAGGAAEFTLAQERVLAADRGLAFLFFSILGGWQPDDFRRESGLPPERIEAYVRRLARLGLIQVGAGGRARALTRRSVTWRRGGPLAVAFDATVKPFFLSMDFGAAQARYVADVAKLSPAGRARVEALLDAVRLDIQLIAEEDRAARHERYDWSAFMLFVRPFDMAEVRRGL
jgi:transcriptional regulator with XRE-family HTH domain